MQCKKDEINEKIKEMALEEFFKVGFKEANVRVIAKGCHITVGNIYRYYPSKAALLEELLEPAYLEIMEFILDNNAFTEALQNEQAGILVYNYFRDFIIKNSKELLVLLNCSIGSKYENTKNQVIEAISNSLSKAYNISNLEVTKLYANLVVSGVSSVLKEYQDKPDVVDYYCTKVLPLMLTTVKKAGLK